MKQYLQSYVSPDGFFNEVRSRLKQPDTPISFIAIDFDNFNYVNDLYGYEIGDKVLDKICRNIDRILTEKDVFCRMHSDHFLICLNNNDVYYAVGIFEEVTDLKQELSEFLPPHYTFVASGGILVVDDYTIPLSALLDQVNFARKLSKGNIVNTFNIYDAQIDENAQWKKQVTCMMEVALNEKEFEIYLQPKVLAKTGEVVGAEALVRWNNKKYGFICPERFVPILEQNGFIRKLDFYVLEEACKFLKKCKNKLPTLPISVNFSKTHLRTELFVERIYEMVSKYELSPRLIEIEFTENMFSEDTERIIEVISYLKFIGFKVSIDDFGCAYSSLNYLKDLPIDIVKIDKAFLYSSTNTEKGKVVLAKVIELIKSLRMLSVMEGVETQEQIDFLQKLSCDFIQGFFYSKPLNITNYKKYIKTHPVLENLNEYMEGEGTAVQDESYLHIIPQEFQMDNWELYTLCKSIDMGLMKGIFQGEVTVQYVNDRALEYLGYTREEFKDVLKNSILAFTHPEDVDMAQKNAQELFNTGKPVSFMSRAIRKDGKVIVLQGRSSCVIDHQGRPIGIYAFQDVTEEIERTAQLKNALENKIRDLEKTIKSEQASREALIINEERYRSIIHQCSSIVNKAFETLYATNNPSACINDILRLLGEWYGVDRAYIFEKTPDNKYFNNTYEWCVKGIAPEKEKLQNIPASDVAKVMEQYNNEGMLYCSNVNKNIPCVNEICANQGVGSVSSLISCIIYDNEEPKGFVGFDFYNKNHCWSETEINVLDYLSRVLAVSIKGWLKK